MVKGRGEVAGTASVLAASRVRTSGSVAPDPGDQVLDKEEAGASLLDAKKDEAKSDGANYYRDDDLVVEQHVPSADRWKVASCRRRPRPRQVPGQVRCPAYDFFVSPFYVTRHPWPSPHSTLVRPSCPDLAFRSSATILVGILAMVKVG